MALNIADVLRAVVQGDRAALHDAAWVQEALSVIDDLAAAVTPGPAKPAAPAKTTKGATS